ncbi:MAG TPA: class I SAM-dependent methyltransferase [Actinomycetota bacterium]|nr:class I SAM-dependent methyltransferase [Actinomycetota bacterium]
MEPSLCPACGSLPNAQPRRAANYELWECSDCGLFFHARPSPEATEDLYEAGYFTGKETFGVGYEDYEKGGVWEASVRWPSLGRELEALVPSKGRLLDVGCAYGFFVDEASKAGWHGIGIDVSRFAIQEGRRRGLDLRAGTLEEASFEDGFFDAIICIQTLEHLPDPAGTLEELARIARRGGALVIDVPSSDSLGFRLRKERWEQIKPPEHLQYFGKKSLFRLLRRAGWQPIKSSSLYDPVYAIAAADAVEEHLGKSATLKKLAVRMASAAGLLKLIRNRGLGTFLRVMAVKTGDSP